MKKHMVSLMVALSLAPAAFGTLDPRAKLNNPKFGLPGARLDSPLRDLLLPPQVPSPKEAAAIEKVREDLQTMVKRLREIGEKLHGASVITDDEHADFKLLCNIASKSIATYPAEREKEMSVAGKVMLNYIVSLAEQYANRVPKEE